MPGISQGLRDEAGGQTLEAFTTMLRAIVEMSLERVLVYMPWWQFFTYGGFIFATLMFFVMWRRHGWHLTWWPDRWFEALLLIALFGLTFLVGGILGTALWGLREIVASEWFYHLVS